MELKANEFKHSATIALEDIQLRTALDRGTRSADAKRIEIMNETTGATRCASRDAGPNCAPWPTCPTCWNRWKPTSPRTAVRCCGPLTPPRPRQQVLEICREHDLKRGVKSKSMVTEEIGLVPFLKQHGGRYAGDRPGRIRGAGR